jgi:hypothetical protein
MPPHHLCSAQTQVTLPSARSSDAAARGVVVEDPPCVQCTVHPPSPTPTSPHVTTAISIGLGFLSCTRVSTAHHTLRATTLCDPPRGGAHLAAAHRGCAVGLEVWHVLRVRVSSCVVKRNSTRGGVCWGGPYHADPPATDGPSLHTFGETQTLEARAVSSSPRTCWWLSGCGGALQDALAGSREPSNSHELHPTRLSPTYERGHPAGCPAHRGGQEESSRMELCTSQLVCTCGELAVPPCSASRLHSVTAHTG